MSVHDKLIMYIDLDKNLSKLSSYFNERGKDFSLGLWI